MKFLIEVRHYADAYASVIFSMNSTLDDLKKNIEDCVGLYGTTCKITLTVVPEGT